MKRILMVGSALMMLSTSAFATQARLLALGMNETDNEGMYYISDSRNIFLNPAYIHEFADRAIVEWGNTGTQVNGSQTGTSDATLSADTTPKAQGGFLKKSGEWTWGVWLGNESNTSALLRIAGTSAVAAMNGYAGTTASISSKMLHTADNQVDFFFGGDNGLKWAVNPTIAMSKDETRSGKDSAYAVRTGVMASNWDAHFNLSLGSKSEATDSASVPALAVAATNVAQEFKGKIGFHVGGSYVLGGNNRVYGYVKHYGWEQTDNFAYTTTVMNNIGGQQGTVKGDFTSYVLGWGTHLDVNSGDKLFASIYGKQTAINLKYSNKSEVRQLLIPVSLGYEAKATEWLVLRGSVVQNLWGKRDNKNIDVYGATGTRLNKVASSTIKAIYGGNGKTTIANSTEVNAGATLTLGQFTIDGLIGTTGTTGTAGSNTGVLSLNNLETSVGLTYKF